MDGNVDAATAVVEDFNHLLIAISLRHTNKPTEFPNTMIDMHHKVTNLKLLDFFQRESHLATTGLVTLEVVLMETVEYLMVSEETNTQIVINETFMKCFVDGSKHRRIIVRRQGVENFL